MSVPPEKQLFRKNGPRPRAGAPLPSTASLAAATAATHCPKPPSAMTSAWVDECAHVTALISGVRGGCCISDGVRLSAECTRLDDLVSKLRSPTEHEQWEATIIAAQELLQQREQQQQEQQGREQQGREQHRAQLEPSWRRNMREFVAESVSPAPQPVDQHDWEGSVVRWARSVLDVQAEVDKLLILTQLAALEQPEHTMTAEQREEEQTEQMVAKQSERVGQLLALLEAQTQLNPAAAANAGSEALFV